MSTASGGRFAGKVAVVTGASRGLGAGLAQRFCDLGMRVGVCARKRPEPPSVADRRHVVSMSADVRDSSDVEGFGAAVVERFGRIDLWVNNAGVVEPIGHLADVDPGMAAHAVAVNISGVANGSRTFARHVRRRRDGGVLVNISSEAATTVYQGWSIYCASKAAVDRLTAVVAAEEAEHDLRCYAVAPGLVDTHVHVDRRSNSPGWVADAIVELAFGDRTGTPPSGSVVQVPDEQAAT